MCFFSRAKKSMSPDLDEPPSPEWEPTYRDFNEDAEAEPLLPPSARSELAPIEVSTSFISEMPDPDEQMSPVQFPVLFSPEVSPADKLVAARRSLGDILWSGDPAVSPAYEWFWNRWDCSTGELMNPQPPQGWQHSIEPLTEPRDVKHRLQQVFRRAKNRVKRQGILKAWREVREQDEIAGAQAEAEPEYNYSDQAVLIPEAASSGEDGTDGDDEAEDEDVVMTDSEIFSDIPAWPVAGRQEDEIDEGDSDVSDDDQAWEFVSFPKAAKAVPSAESSAASDPALVFDDDDDDDAAALEAEGFPYFAPTIEDFMQADESTSHG